MNKIFFKKVLPILLTLCILTQCIFLCGCKKTLSRTFFAADTVCTITVYNGEQTALDNAVNRVNLLAGKLDANAENSEISLLNKNKEVENVSKELYEIISSGLEFSKTSNGVFDISVRPVTKLWNFKGNDLPDKKNISDALKKVGYENITLNSGNIYIKNGGEIELGAIAKGYICDEVEKSLKNDGVSSAIINLGGNVTVLGTQNGKNFSVGIQKPFSQDIAATLKVSNISVVTSGTYQRYIEKDNTIYHHLLNTKTGFPEQNELNSVTVISKSSTVADALSTTCFLLGTKKGLNLINSTPGVFAVFIDKERKLTLSNGLEYDKNGDIIISE